MGAFERGGLPQDWRGLGAGSRHGVVGARGAAVSRRASGRWPSGW